MTISTASFPLFQLYVHQNGTMTAILVALCFGVYVMYTALLRPIRDSRWSCSKKREPDKKVVCFVRASPFSSDSVPTDIDTIVIGSGPGGCTCANLLAQQGRKVLVLEQHQTKTGGGTHSFQEQGCEWDTGLHYSSQAMSDKTARAGSIMDYMSRGTQRFRQFPEPYDEIIFPDHLSYPYMNGKERTIDAILHKLEPHNDKDEMRRRVETYMGLYSDIHAGFVALGLSRVLPRCLQFLVRARVEELMKLASFTVRDVQYAILNLGYTKELLLKHACPHAPVEEDHDLVRRRLKAILSHPIGDYGTQPREASFAAHGVTAEHYIDGGSYTVGPTQNISIRLTSVVRELGGEVLVDATVRQIIVDNERAVGVLVSRSSDLEKMGEEAPVTEIRAKNVVCATSAYNLYTKLLPQELPVTQKFMDPNERTMRQSNGHLFVFCKIRGDPEELKLPDHNLWVFNEDSTRDLDKAFDDFYSDPFSNRPPIIYLGFPCTKDPTWSRRFKNTSNCIVIADGLYRWFEQWSSSNKIPRKRGKDYENLKAALTKNLVEVLYEFVPQVKGKLEYVHVASPLTEESFLGSYRGGAYDTLCSTAMFAPVNQKWITTPHTPIQGLYVAGSSAFFPGLTGSMYGGCLSACAVLGYLGSVRLGLSIVKHLARRLREANPKMGWVESYRAAFSKFVNE